MTDIKEILHYYIDQPCEVVTNEGQEFIWNLTYLLLGHLDQPRTFSTDVNTIKPILRSLYDMTNEEAIETARLIYEYEDFTKIETRRNSHGHLLVEFGTQSRKVYNATMDCMYNPDQFRYLIKKGFDIFELIHEGLALDAKSIQPPQVNK